MYKNSVLSLKNTLWMAHMHTSWNPWSIKCLKLLLGKYQQFKMQQNLLSQSFLMIYFDNSKDFF